jgi:predicted nucleotidyltransferase
MDGMPIAEARAGLSRLLADFRMQNDVEVVVIGSHRRPEAALIPYGEYRELTRPDAAASVGLARLRELKNVIAKLAAVSHLEDVRVYGSVARGDESAGSDVDLLVAPTAEATLFDIAQFELVLEAILHVLVSVVSIDSLDDRDRRIVDEAVRL